MATSVRSSSQNSSTTGTAVSIAAPTGTTTGDVVIVTVHVNGQTTIVDNNGSTAFTEDLNDYKPNTTSGQTVSVFSRRIVGGDPTTYSFTSGATGRWSAIAVTFQSPNATTIYDLTPSSTRANNLDSPPGSSGATAPDVTTLTDNAIHCACAFIDASTDDFTGWPSGYSVSQSVDNNQGQTFTTKIIALASATGTQAFTHNGTGTAYIALSFAVKNDSAPLVSTLSDNFDDNSIDTAKWTSFTASSGAIAETNQNLEYSLNLLTSGSWAGLTSKLQYNLTGSQASIKFVSATTGNTYLDLTLSVEKLGAPDNFISIGIDVGRQKLQAVKEVATVDTVLAEIDYVAATHVYGRVRESGGTVFWDWSTDGLSWTNLFNVAPPITITNVYVILDDYEYDGLSVPNTHKLDNFNILPSSITIGYRTLLGIGI